MITCSFENGNNASLRHVVVHAIVEKDNALLLVKRAPHLLEGGKWSIPSGFLDRDETADQGALRELYEETGWEGTVTSLFMIKTAPNRPHEDRQNVSFHYVVAATRRLGKPDTESSDIQWIPITELPPLDTLAFDHGEAIDAYIRFRKTPFSLPLVR
jgi:8-oxo-dGTP diphosphatase